MLGGNGGNQVEIIKEKVVTNGGNWWIEVESVATRTGSMSVAHPLTSTQLTLNILRDVTALTNPDSSVLI